PVEDDAGEHLSGDRHCQIGGHPRDLAVGSEALQKRLADKPRRMRAHDRDRIHPERSDRRNPSSSGWLSHFRRDARQLVAPGLSPSGILITGATEFLAGPCPASFAALVSVSSAAVVCFFPCPSCHPCLPCLLLIR